MTKNQHLLQILSEECVEVSKEVSKALRFGTEDFYPGDPNKETNATLISKEFIEAIAVRNMLVEAGVLTIPIDAGEIAEAKRARVLKYLEYSRNAGMLDE